MVSKSLLLVLPVLRAVHAAGSVRVVNNCGAGVPVHYASVYGNTGPALQPLPASGYSEPFSKDNVGVSIKLAPAANGAVTQFEYTWTSGNKQVAYDISNIDGNPFAQYGTSLVPSVGSSKEFPSCVAINCPAGQDRCEAAYNLPDDVRTQVCPDNAVLTFTLCPGGPVNGGYGVAAENSEPAASPSGAEQSKGPASAPVATQGSSPGGEKPQNNAVSQQAPVSASRTRKWKSASTAHARRYAHADKVFD